MKIITWPWWCWPEGCGRFHNWANPSHGCSSQPWWFPGAWTMSGPTFWSHQRLGCRGWHLPVDVTGGALGEETPTPGCPKHKLRTWWPSDCTMSTHKHTGKKTRSFGIFLFIIFYLLPCQQYLGERIFRLSRKWSSNLLLWNISVAILGKKGIAGEQVQPPLLILSFGFLAVKAKLSLRECVLGERRPVQVPLHFHLNAKRSLSSRKWHVLKDLSAYSAK